MKLNNCLIIANGYEKNIDYINDYIVKNKPYIICVDGGINCLFKFNIIPHILIGDFDSFSFDINILKKLNIHLIKLNYNKKFSDLKYAIDVSINLNFNFITILNSTYGRIDHFLNNLYLLEYCYNKNIICQIINYNNKIMYWDGSIINLKKSKFYKYFSIIPISNELIGLTLYGVKYSINNQSVLRYNINTISNEYLNHNNFLYYKRGKALIIFSKDSDNV